MTGVSNPSKARAKPYFNKNFYNELWFDTSVFLQIKKRNFRLRLSGLHPRQASADAAPMSYEAFGVVWNERIGKNFKNNKA
jgi:hypothetical protein